MTTIAAQKFEDKIIIGTDSQVTSHSMITSDQHSDNKIFTGADCLVAATGYLGEASLLELYAKDHSIGEGGKLRLLEWLLEFSEWQKKKTGAAVLNNHCLIAHKSGLYRSNKLSISSCDTFTAMGSGGDYALTALHLGHSVKKAIKVSCELDIFSSEPVQLLEMKLG